MGFCGGAATVGFFKAGVLVRAEAGWWGREGTAGAAPALPEPDSRLFIPNSDIPRGPGGGGGGSGAGVGTAVADTTGAGVTGRAFARLRRLLLFFATIGILPSFPQLLQW